MKRILLIVMLLLLTLTSCVSKDSAADSVDDSETDPIYNESAAFNNLNEPSSSVAEDAGNVDIAESTDSTEHSVKDAFSQYETALSAAEKLTSYRMKASVAVAIEIEGTSVELEKSTVKGELDPNGDYTVNRRTDLKDTHNTSISQTVEDSYGNKKAGKNYLKTEYSDFTGNDNGFLENKRSSYRRPLLISNLGEVKNMKQANIDTVTVTEADGATTIKFMLGAKFAANAVKAELDTAGINVKVSDITISYFIVTAVIDSDGILVAGDVSARVAVDSNGADTVYTVSREFSVSDKNSTSILCTKPEWL